MGDYSKCNEACEWAGYDPISHAGYRFADGYMDAADNLEFRPPSPASRDSIRAYALGYIFYQHRDILMRKVLFHE